MKKLIVIIGIGLALCAIASTQTSKEYVDRRDNEILSHAKEYTDDSVSGLAHEEDIPTKVSQLQNDTGYVTGSATNGLVERANSYADEKSRQTLLAAKQYTDNATNGQSKVMSVNGRTGNVVLSSVDVHARPDNWMPSAEDVGAQPKLVSGTNIKTVNGNSLLGSGNIEIRGGGGGGVDTNAVREIVLPMIDEAVADRVRFENLATEWIAGESYTNGQPVYVKVCLTAVKNIFICIKAHDGDDEVNFDDTEYWCPIQDYEFASQNDLHRVETNLSSSVSSLQSSKADQSQVDEVQTLAQATYEQVQSQEGWIVNADQRITSVEDNKANRPTSYTSGNLAALDGNGNTADSGIDARSVLFSSAELDDPITLAYGSGEGLYLGHSYHDGPWGHWLVYGVNAPWFIDRNGQSPTDPREPATIGDIPVISAADPTFSNAVLSVGINTNLVASIGEINDFIHGYGELGATSLGGLVLALLGAAALLRKKTALLKSDGTAEDDFATDLLGKQVAKDAIAYKVATVAGENRSVKVYTVDTGNIEFSVAPPTGATGVIDYEVWLDARLVSALPTITINGTYTTNTGKTILEGCAAGVINIIHCTFVEGAGVTAVVAQFKGVTA